MGFGRESVDRGGQRRVVDRANAASRSVLVIALAALALPAAPARADTAHLLLRAKMPAAMAPLARGRSRLRELRSGRIWRVSAGGHRGRRVVARVAVSTRGLRGLLGLAADARGRIFADWT